ncbi:MAG: NAD+ synthase [Burkholderiales bacterium]
MSIVKIAIAQGNYLVGDLAGNVDKILHAAMRARQAGAGLLLTTELALCGYPPEDLLLRDDFCRDCARALDRLVAKAAGIALVVGHPQQAGGRRYNAASLIRGGRIVATYFKHRLPNHTVFDEARYFTAGSAPCVFEHGGVRFGINICADVWQRSAVAAARGAGAEVLLVLNASPYHMNKQFSRHEVIRERVAETGLPVIYANQVGGQDELVFDGASFAIDGSGGLTHQLPAFEEALGLIELAGAVPVKGEIAPPLPLEAEVYKALTLGVRDYVGKNGFPGVLLGLSGGIDSALTLAVAADALGAARVRAVMMPSRHTAQMSREDARAMAAAFGVRYTEIAIEPVFDAFLEALAGEFRGLPADAAEENLQARIRGALLMALSNKTGAIVLTTGNKSEMGIGHATLYGDMAGGFAVLKDISKTLVYRLAAYRNTLSPGIPQRVFERAPSAELRAGQRDQDTLPPHDILDAILEAHVERGLDPDEVVASGYRPQDVRDVVRRVWSSEYKRRQAPPGIRITDRAFGKDWRFPITNKYRSRCE